MELLHVLGNTYAAVAATALLPVYKLNDRDVVLIDTGYAKLDRAGLTALIDGQGWRLRAILCSHAHFDHTGNVRYLHSSGFPPADRGAPQGAGQADPQVRRERQGGCAEYPPGCDG